MNKFFFFLIVFTQNLNALCQRADFGTFAIQTEITITQNPFKQKNNTLGSSFLFPQWVHGRVINTKGEVFSDGLFNLDKVSQNLYLRMEDSAVGFLIDNNQLSSIMLQDAKTKYYFEKLPLLKTNLFYCALVKGSKYALYSLIKTKFIPSNYHTNGMVSTGNLYDEYKDEVIYYIVFGNENFSEINLKKKSIRKVLEGDKTRVENYFNQHGNDNIDEQFLISLIGHLNN